ncbi:uncharacterized protein [Hetaerina americana]|uniref:uncharacterized protein n=1 Tax=Hetaerina americana TaxID=62018 RepID=UPI003A7F5C41
MAPFHHRPLPALLPLLLLYASSAPEYSPRTWALAKALSGGAPSVDEAQMGVAAAAQVALGGAEGTLGDPKDILTPSATPIDTDKGAAAAIDAEEAALLNTTQSSLMLPAPLVATKKNPEGDEEGTAAEHGSPPSSLQAVPSTSRTTTALTTESPAPTIAITTSEPYRETPPPAAAGGASVTLRPPWVPHIHHTGHHHGGTSRFGPYFEEGADGSNVTARLGSTVRLDCKIGMLQDKTVTWLHRKDDAIHLLTVGRQAYSSDSRFSLAYRYPNNWRLQILFVNRRDEGLYECQVATHPPRIRQVFLRVTAPVLKIVDENHHEVLERYYKAGSEVELTCLASQLEEGDGASEASEGDHKGGAHTTTPLAPSSEAHKGVAGRVLWRHGDSAISHNSSGRGVGVNVSADGRNVAVTLTLEAARKGDGGNYTCSVGGLSSATVAIHILNDSSTGELPAAVQHGNSTVPFGVVSMWLQLCCLALSLSVITR